MGPVWLRHLLRPHPAPIPWERAIRTGLAVAAPVGVGMATGELGPGVIASLGALAASLGDRGGPFRQRSIRVATVAAAGATGITLGSAAFGHSVLAILVVVGVAFVSGLVSVLGNVASFASLQLLVYAVVGAGLSFGVGPLWHVPAFYLTGAGWELAISLLLSLSTGKGRVSAPERAAVAKVYTMLGHLLAGIGTSSTGTAGADARRQQLTAALNEAYDAVIAARSRAGGRGTRFRQLLALLNEATPLVEAAHVLVRHDRRVPPQVIQAVQGTAIAIRRRAAPPEPPVVGADSPGLAHLVAGMESVRALLAGTGPGDVSHLVLKATLRQRLAATWDILLSRPATMLATLRLTLCMAVAEIVMHALPLQRPYWVALTVAVSLKPDIGSVFARAVQRGVGTAVGVVIGTVLVVVIPQGPGVLVAIAVCAALMPVGEARNYGLYTTSLTPLVVLLLELLHRGDNQLIMFRLIDTLLGSAIVLLVGFLPWPDSWRSRRRIPDSFADAADDVLAYLRVALGPDDSSRQGLRRHTYRRLSDLRTVFQQALAEPPPASRWAAAWWPGIVALERLTDAVTALVVHAERDGPKPPADGVREVLVAMDDLRVAARHGRIPEDLPLPDDEALAGIVAELRVARAVLSSPR
ncbi:membrane protein [Tersicoccus solisilvae]|uniref:Membrane protein n=2 Tax=Tersicoccus solisilvae TaxID=1882339 RepID=A0ABQ1NRH4_9MICC|nr:membrane protein [Tersicoccus solisilvae]